MIEMIVFLLMGIGLMFQFLGTVALFRFPDVYTRLHGTTKCTTFGTIFTCLAVAAYGVMLALGGKPEYSALSIHAIVAVAFVMVTNAVGSHAIARAAHRSGTLPKRAVVDKLKEAGL